MVRRQSKALISITVTLFRSFDDLPSLLEALELLTKKLAFTFRTEVVFVSDASPDKCVEYLKQMLPRCGFESQLHVLERNYGATFALRCAWEMAKGDFIAPLPPDLQDPPEIVEKALLKLAAGEADVCIGVRRTRQDPWLETLLQKAFWLFYSSIISTNVPIVGIDFFAVTKRVKNVLLRYREPNSFLIGILLHAGYRNCRLEYDRKSRVHGRSSWSFSKKFRYFADSIFFFSRRPVQLIYLLSTGFGVLSGLFFVSWLLTERSEIFTPLAAVISVATSSVLFSGALLGEYIFRILDTAASRPLMNIMSSETFTGRLEASLESMENSAEKECLSA